MSGEREAGYARAVEEMRVDGWTQETARRYLAIAGAARGEYDAGFLAAVSDLAHGDLTYMLARIRAIGGAS